MLENLKRLREPLGWLLLAAILGNVALSAVSHALEARDAADSKELYGAFAAMAGDALSLTLVVPLVAVVCLCLFVAPIVPRALALTRASVVVVLLGTLLTIAAMVLGVAASAGVVGAVFEVLGGLLDVALKIAAVVVLWVIVRAFPSGRLTAAEPAAAPLPPDAAGAAPAGQVPVVWQAGAAAGSAWATAAEAAEGAGASAPAVPVPATPPAADAAPRNAWALPPSQAGAAEAIGWRPVPRAADPASRTEGDPSRDTP